MESVFFLEKSMRRLSRVTWRTILRPKFLLAAGLCAQPALGQTPLPPTLLGPTAVYCSNRTVSLDDHGLREDHFVALSGVNCLPGSLTITSYPITFDLDKSEKARISAVTVCCVAPIHAPGQGPAKVSVPVKK